MTAHTISLEQQGKADERLTLQPAFREVHRGVTHDRCQHEARGRSGIIRQCRNRSVTVVEGQRLCSRHINPEAWR